MRMIAITAALVAAGCTQPALSGGGGDGAGAAPSSGIYDVTSTTTGDCHAVESALSGYITSVQANGFVLSVPGERFLSANGDAPAFGASLEIFPISNGSFAQSRDVCGAQLTQRFTVEETTSDHVRVRRDDGYGNLAAVDPSCLPGLVPASDCSQSTELDYRLNTPCPQSCIQTAPIADPTQPLAFTCSC